MNDHDIRLECLRLANASIGLAASRAATPGTPKSTVELAQEYYAFVWGQSQTPKQFAA